MNKDYKAKNGEAQEPQPVAEPGPPRLPWPSLDVEAIAAQHVAPQRPGRKPRLSHGALGGALRGAQKETKPLRPIRSKFSRQSRHRAVFAHANTQHRFRKRGEGVHGLLPTDATGGKMAEDQVPLEGTARCHLRGSEGNLSERVVVRCP